MADQMIFKRYEIKYLLTRKQYQQIRVAMDGLMAEDKYGRSTIHSLYLDTPDFLLARRSLEKPLYKEKLRLRSYGDTDGGTVFVEIKKKYDSIVYKRRISMTETAAREYVLSHKAAEDSQISREISYFMAHYKNLMPKILISYERDAFYSTADNDLRITFDRNILWRDNDLKLTSKVDGIPVLDSDLVLMEIKTTAAMPLWLVKTLSRNHIYKTSFSKYGTAYQMMLQNRQIPAFAGSTNEHTNYNFTHGGNYNYA